MAVEVILSDHPFLGESARPNEPERAEKWRNELGEARHRAVIVVPTSRRKRMLAQELAETHVVLPRIITLQGLVADLAGKMGSTHRAIGSAEQALIMARVLQVGRYTAGPGLVAQALKRRQLNRDQLKSNNQETELANPLDPICTAYDQLLKTSGVVDGIDTIDQVTNALNNTQSILTQLVETSMPLILFDGFHHFTQPEISFLTAIGSATEIRLWLSGTHGQPWREDADRILEGLSIGTGRTSEDLSEPPTDLAAFGRGLFLETTNPVPPGISLVEITQDEDMAAWVASKVAHILRTDPSISRTPGKLAIVVPNPGRATAIREALTAAGIPCSAQAEWINLADSRPVRMVQVALECRNSRFHHSDIFQILASPAMRGNLNHAYLLPRLRSLGIGNLQAQTPDAWLEFWNRAITAESTQEGVEPTWIKSIRELSECVAERLTLIGNIFGSEIDIKKPGRWLSGQVASLLSALEFQNRLLPKYAPSGIPDRELEEDQLGWHNLIDAIDSMAETPGPLFPIKNDLPDLELALRLAVASDRFTLRSHDIDRVGIIRPLALRGLELDTVIWAGLNEGEYPASSRGTDDLTIDEKFRRGREQDYLFTQAFESTKRRVIFARSCQRGAEALQAGPYWQKMLKKTNIKPQREVPDAADACGIVRARSQAPEPEIASWVRRQNTPELEPWTAPLMQARWSPDKTFSPTALEGFAACPFRFFGERTLRLREEQEDRMALTYGTAVHAALALLLPGEQKFPPNSAALRESLQTELTASSQYIEPIHHALAERLANRAWHDALLNSVSQGSEIEFNNVIGTDKNGNEVRVTGKIDLVLRLADGSVAVIDFKTGSLDTQRNKCQDTRLVQPGLYGYIARTGCENLPGTTVDIHAAYVGLKGSKCEILATATMPNVNKSKHTLSLDLESVTETIIQHAEKIRTGRIELTQYGPESKHPECTSYCSMRDACRHPLTPKTPFKRS